MENVGCEDGTRAREGEKEDGGSRLRRFRAAPFLIVSQSRMGRPSLRVMYGPPYRVMSPRRSSQLHRDPLPSPFTGPTSLVAKKDGEGLLIHETHRVSGSSVVNATRTFSQCHKSVQGRPGLASSVNIHTRRPRVIYAAGKMNASPQNENSVHILTAGII